MNRPTVQKSVESEQDVSTQWSVVPTSRPQRDQDSLRS